MQEHDFNTLLNQIDKSLEDIPLNLMKQGFIAYCDDMPNKTILIKQNKGYIVEYVVSNDNDKFSLDIQEKIIRQLTSDEYNKVIEQYKQQYKQ